MQSKRVLRQQDRFRILGDLAGVIPHEIKNALVPLRTLGDLLPDRYNNPDFRAWYANTVRQEVDRTSWRSSRASGTASGGPPSAPSRRRS